jgi:very-short-patch-repair endonuclease
VVEVAHVQVAATARRQRGRITVAQLREAGRGRGAVAHDTATGRLVREHRSVYAVGHDAPARFAAEAAALLAAGTAAVISHLSAAHVWGMLKPPGPKVVDVTVPTPRRSRDGIRLHRTRNPDPRDRTRRYDLAITTPARTLLDLAEQVDFRTLEHAFNEALAQQLTTASDVHALLDRSPGRRGAAPLRRLLRPNDGFTRNKAERAMRALNQQAGLPRARYNRKLGPYELDTFYPDHNLDVEIDGHGPHGTPRARERDLRRDADLKANYGIDVIRIPWPMLRDEPAAVAVLIARATSPGTTRA